MELSLLRGMVTSLGLRAEPEPLGGATGAVWAVGKQVLRIGPRIRMDKEVAASTAASTVVRVPRVLDRVDVGDQSGLLLERIRGIAVGDLSSCDEAGAEERGRRCGSLHQALAAVPAPVALPTAPGLEAAGPSPSLLHLDLHPFNVLLDETGTPTVIDWANAAAGPAELDVARTAMLLTFDPAARALSSDPRCRALFRGWGEASRWDDIDYRSRAWALEFMLHDLSDRYARAELEPLRARLAELDSSSGSDARSGGTLRS
ncbi:MAG: phosphotransferase [Propionibacteriaceae bacterium]